MNDRLKYRAYCRFYNGEQGYVFFDAIKGLKSVLDDDFITTEIKSVEQCTSCQDRNGTNMYEGDIVKQWYINKHVFCVVAHDNSSFVFKNKNGRCYPLHNDCEIIGTISEYPDLF